MANHQNDELKFEIINKIGILSENGSWQLELNRISWNGMEPKYDLRKWSADHKKVGKGITFTDKELITLQKLLTDEIAFLQTDQE